MAAPLPSPPFASGAAFRARPVVAAVLVPNFVVTWLDVDVDAARTRRRVPALYSSMKFYASSYNLGNAEVVQPLGREVARALARGPRDKSAVVEGSPQDPLGG
jgi:hypothetical protein